MLGVDEERTASCGCVAVVEHVRLFRVVFFKVSIFFRTQIATF
jgi:hypothetical protein